MEIPFPETLIALQAQFRWLEEGKKPAVLVPYWSPNFPHSPKLKSISVPQGQLFFRADYCGSFKWVDENIGLTLGYGVGSKPKEPSKVFVLEQEGFELLSVVADKGTERIVEFHLNKLVGDEQNISLTTWSLKKVVMHRIKWWETYYNLLEEKEVVV